jgi:hypothetical protein
MRVERVIGVWKTVNMIERSSFSFAMQDPSIAAEASRGDAAALEQALAWVLRNRAAAGLAHRRAYGRRHPEFGGGGLGEAAHGLARFLAAEAPTLAAMLRTASVPAPSKRAPAPPDPTAGALFLHGHWHSPRWAGWLKATALIGPYLFLTFPTQTS